MHALVGAAITTTCSSFLIIFRSCSPYFEAEFVSMYINRTFNISANTTRTEILGFDVILSFNVIKHTGTNIYTLCANGYGCFFDKQILNELSFPVCIFVIVNGKTYTNAFPLNGLKNGFNRY